MDTIRIKTNCGEPREIRSRKLDALAALLDGPPLAEGHANHDIARTIWNGLIDKRPASIAQCAGRDDVARCNHFAREHDLLVSIQGGSHSASGKAVPDDGLMIDRSALTEVRVGPARQTVMAQPGTGLLRALDETTIELLLEHARKRPTSIR